MQTDSLAEIKIDTESESEAVMLCQALYEAYLTGKVDALVKLYTTGAPDYATVREAIALIEQGKFEPEETKVEDGVEEIVKVPQLWKHLLIANAPIFELPTAELLHSLQLLIDILEIDHVIELESRQGFLTFALRNVLPGIVKLDHNTSRQNAYSSYFERPAVKVFGDFILTLTHNVANKRAAVVMSWPEMPNCIESLLSKKKLVAVIVIGEPPGGSCMPRNAKEVAMKYGYQQHVLNLKQVCHMDTTRDNNSLCHDETRSAVTLYLSTEKFPICTEEGFRTVLGSSLLGPAKAVTDVTDNCILLDYALDGRIPFWITQITEKEQQAEAAKIVFQTMKCSGHYDGQIPYYVGDDKKGSEPMSWDDKMAKLQFWFERNDKHSFPLSINESNFEQYYDDIVQLTERGLAYYRNRDSGVRIKPYIKTITDAEKYLWVHYSQKVAPMGWNTNRQIFLNRFNQLFDAYSKNHKLSCQSFNAHEDNIAMI
jgi:hypothetical protein